MNFLTILLILISLQSSLSILKHKLWDYRGPTGEQNWYKQYSHCKGQFQSPINIEMDRIIYVPNLQLLFINYDNNLHSMRLINNGHGVKLYRTNDDDNIDCFISGTALNTDIYRFQQLHFHWSNSHSAGSEHAIDGKKFTMEMHIVHQNMRYFQNEALFNSILGGDLTTVIAVFFNETDHHNKYLDPIVNHLQNIIQVDTEYELNESIKLSNLLPSNKEIEYLRYYGSYTTPDCLEIVTWILYPKPLQINVEQMNKFRELLFNTTIYFNKHHHFNHLNHKHKLRKKFKFNNNNDETLGYYRHIQELGTRKIYSPLVDSSCSLSLYPLSIILLIIIIQINPFL